MSSVNISVAVTFESKSSRNNLQLFALCDKAKFYEGRKDKLSQNTDFLVGQLFSQTQNSLASSALIRDAKFTRGERKQYSLVLGDSQGPSKSLTVFWVYGPPGGDCIFSEKSFDMIFLQRNSKLNPTSLNLSLSDKECTEQVELPRTTSIEGGPG